MYLCNTLEFAEILIIITVFLTKNILISNILLTLTSPKSWYNQLEESFALLRTTVHHLGSATCFPYKVNIMTNHSINKINMALKKKIGSRNLRGNVSVYLFRNYSQPIWWVYNITLLFGGSSFNIHVFQISQTGHSSKTFFRLIDRCVLENFCASGTQDAGVTESLHFCLWLGNEHGWQFCEKFPS